VSASALLDQVLTAKRAIDGDTYVTGAGDDYESHRVTGFDTPEVAHRPGDTPEPGATTATAVLDSVLSGATFQEKGQDHFGRTLVEGTLANGAPLDEAMIRSGAALPMTYDATSEQLNAQGQAALRQIDPASRTQLDDQLDADRASIRQSIDITDYLDKSPSMKPEGDFSRAIDRGTANLVGSLGAAGEFLGDRFGIDSLQRIGGNTVARSMVKGALNPASIGDHENIRDFGDLGTWIVEKVGENIPNMASLVAGGLVGAGGKLAVAGIGKAALQEAAREAGKKAVLSSWAKSEGTAAAAAAGTAASEATTAAGMAARSAAMASGAKYGAGAAIYPQHLGESVQELKSGGIDTSELNSPYLTAAINTALDVAPMEALLKYSFSGLKSDMAKDLVRQSFQVMSGKEVFKTALKGVGKGAAAGIAAEMPTEMAQELVDLAAHAYHDPTFDMFSDKNIHRVIEAGLAGGVVGGAFGAGGRGSSETARAVYDYLGQQKDADPTVEIDDGQEEENAAEGQTNAEALQGTGVLDGSGADPGAAVPPGPGASSSIADATQAQAPPSTTPFGGAPVEAPPSTTPFGGAPPASTAATVLDQLLAPDALEATAEREAIQNETPLDPPRAVLEADEAPPVDGQAAYQKFEDARAPVVPAARREAVAARMAQANSLATDMQPLPPEEPSPQYDDGARIEHASEDDAAQFELGAQGSGVHVESGMPHTETIDLLNRGKNDDDTVTKAISADSAQAGRRGVHRVINALRHALVKANPGYSAPDVTLMHPRDEKEAGGQEFTLSVEDSHSDLAEKFTDTAADPVRMSAKVRTFVNKTEGKGLTIDLKLPPKDERGGLSPKFIRSLIHAAWNGEISEDGALDMIAPDGKGIRFNLAELINAGREELNGEHGEGLQDSRVAALSAVSWLLDNGFLLTTGKRHSNFLKDARVGLSKTAPLWTEALSSKSGVTDFYPIARESSDEELRAALDVALEHFIDAKLRRSNGLPNTPEALKSQSVSEAKSPTIRRVSKIIDAIEKEMTKRGLDTDVASDASLPEFADTHASTGVDEKLTQQIRARKSHDTARREGNLEAVAGQNVSDFDMETGDTSTAGSSDDVAVPLPTEDQQAAEAARTSKSKASIAPVRDTTVEVAHRSEDPRLAKEATFLTTILRATGVKLMHLVSLTDLMGVEGLIAQERDAYAAAADDHKTAETAAKDESTEAAARREASKPAKQAAAKLRMARAEYNAALLSKARTEVQTARVVFIKVDEKHARPVIVISDSTSGRPRARALLHEAGHIVMRHYLSSAPEAAKTEMRKAWGEPGSTDFEENFADSFLNWALSQSNAVAAVEPGRNRFHQAIQTLFTEMGASLRKLWSQARKEADVKYSEFIELLVNRKRRDMGEREFAPKTPFGKGMQRAMKVEGDTRSPLLSADGPASLDMTTPTNAQAKELWRKAKATPFGEAVKGTSGTLNEFRKAWFQGEDIALRQMGNAFVTLFANHFRREPGKQTTGLGFARYDDHVRGLTGPWLNRIIEIAEKHVPAFKIYHILPYVKAPEPDAVAQQAADYLLEEGDLPNTQEPAVLLAKQIRGLFEELYAWLRTTGVSVPHRKHYFPIAMNTSKLMAAGAHARVREIFQAWAQTPAAQKWWAEKQAKGDKGKGNITSAISFPDPQEFADHMYSVWTGTGGVMELERQMLEGNVETVDFLSPGFSRRKQRQLPRELIQSLAEFRERDLVQVMTSYTRSAVKRGVWQQRFGAPEDSEMAQYLGQVNDAFDRAMTKVDYDAAFDMRDKLQLEVQTKYGINLFDPSAQLKADLIKEVRAGRLTQQQYDHITMISIPSYMGTLGADFAIGGKARPGLRNFTQLMLVYQGVRTLSMSVLSQFVDIATIANRVGTADSGKAMKVALKAMHGAGRQERLELARTFGILQKNATEHMLNDETGILAFSRNLTHVNETFFKYNGMHALTNWTRSIDLMIAKSLIQSWVEEGATDKLGELGMTVDQARAWMDGGSRLDWDDQHSAVLGGINQFIDESMVRPSAALRPRLLNDQRFAIFGHLKSFMYGFQYQVLDRTWTKMVQKWGEEEGMRKFTAALPALLLAAWTLPMAALGMEIRWLIAPPKDGEPEGWDYAWETLQRSGDLGLAQMAVDMYETQDHGKPFTLSLMGPAVSQGYDLATKDLFNSDGSASSTLVKSMPAYPLLQWLGAAFH